MTTNNTDKAILGKLRTLKSEKLELQKRLDCIKELLDIAYEENCMNLYTPQGVNQAHRVAAGGELPKRVKQ